MSQAESAEPTFDSDDPASGLPQDHGWAMWAGGRCSITRCIEPPVAAVERAASGRRPAHWQAYCVDHARSRGVQLTSDGLVWTSQYLEPPGRARSQPTA